MKLTALLATVIVTSTIAMAGTVTEYTDRTAFNTAVGPVTLEDFTSTDHFPITTGVLNSSTNLPGIGITPGLIQPGVTYTSPVTGTSNDFNIDAGGGYVGGFLDSLIGDGASTRPLTATFNGPVGAFGFDTNQLGGASESIVINFSGGGSYSTTLNPGSGLTFFGFQSSAQDITSFVLQYNDPTQFGFAMDNFAFTPNGAGGGGSEVPEPTSVLLVGGGLVGLAALRRKFGRGSVV